MFNVKSGYLLLIGRDIPTSRLILAVFAVFLVIVLVILLLKKLRGLSEDSDPNDNDFGILNPGLPVSPPAPLSTEMASTETMVTENKVAEPPSAEQPVKNASEINAILNSLSDIIFEFDENKICRNIWYSKSRVLRVDLQIFRNKTIIESLGEEKGRQFDDALNAVMHTGQATTIEFLSFFGTGRWFSTRFSPVFDEFGNFNQKVTVAVTDISEQKKYATELKEQQAHLLEAQRIARLGNWWYDIDSKFTFWSDNLYTLLDIASLPANMSHFEYYVSRVEANDRRSVYKFFSDLSANPLNEIEHRLLTETGKIKIFKITHGQPIKDNDGRIIRITGVIQDITHHRVTERTIKKSQTELLEARTIAKIGNWKWDIIHKNLTWSDEVYHIHEVDIKRPDSPGISNFKLLLKYVHPDDKFILLSFLKNPANMRRSSYEYRIVTPQGKLKFVNIIITRIKTAEDGSTRNVTGTLQDITDRKSAEMNIRKTEDNYKLVMESIKLAAVTLDKTGVIIFCNRYLSNLLGYQQAQLIGLNWFQHFIPADIKHVFDGWYQKNNILSNYINPIICRNGEQRIISWQNTTIYDENGNIKQTTSIGEDITDQQKDRELLITAKEEAERSSLFKSEFLSTMSHEIRTPMNAVIGTTNLLLEENPRADQLTYLKNLKFSGETLLGIINDILDYNKIEAGKLELSKLQVNLHALVANIKQSFMAKALEKKLDIIVEVDEQIPQNLIGDPLRLGQILNNLLSNAIKFTHKGTINILIREEARMADRVKLDFTVADTGIGIEPQNLEKIFEPFIQETQHQDYGGTGLGLAIIRRLVELHGSHINVSSTLGKGTQFKFAIEFEYTAEPLVKPKLTAIQKMQEADLTGMKVLVVDDNKMNIIIASRFLHKWNITIDEAQNGAIAIEMVQNNFYDLIIMDLQMPVMDGFEATKVIKENYPELPIIALTADAMPETYAKARNSGMNDYLTKPFMPEILFEKVSKYYGH
jgi:PAS domain S-box-containing protein